MMGSWMVNVKTKQLGKSFHKLPLENLEATPTRTVSPKLESHEFSTGDK